MERPPGLEGELDIDIKFSSVPTLSTATISASNLFVTSVNNIAFDARF